MPFSVDDKIKALRREIAMRKAVYYRWVKDRQMRPEEAAYEIGVMEAILHDYAEPQPQLPLDVPRETPAGD
jgi:hypothetical protein